MSGRASLPLLFLTLAACASSGGAPGPTSTGDPWADLMAGNARFVAGTPTHQHDVEAQRREVAESQAPTAIVLTCADSRVSPEFVFDQGVGDLFVVRVAGNTPGPLMLGSME